MFSRGHIVASSPSHTEKFYLFLEGPHTHTHTPIKQYMLHAPPGLTGRSTKGVGSYNSNSKGQMILLRCRLVR